jgi:hypothetical protein
MTANPNHRGSHPDAQLGQTQLEDSETTFEGGVEVPEEKIAGAMRLLFALANLKAQPTAALSIAAVMTRFLFRSAGAAGARCRAPQRNALVHASRIQPIGFLNRP